MKKHIVCLGDSNTHGYCADPGDCADHGDRFNEEERWPCLLQKHLGEEYLVLEEGLSGRTTVFNDPLHESMAALAIGLERLLLKAMSVPAWKNNTPNILVVCPPHIGEGLWDEPMGKGCPEKSRALAKYYKPKCDALGVHFLDAEGIAEFNRVDFMHLTRKGHADLAEALGTLVPTLA